MGRPWLLKVWLLSDSRARKPRRHLVVVQISAGRMGRPEMGSGGASDASAALWMASIWSR